MLHEYRNLNFKYSTIKYNYTLQMMCILSFLDYMYIFYSYNSSWKLLNLAHYKEIKATLISQF